MNKKILYGLLGLALLCVILLGGCTAPTTTRSADVGATPCERLTNRIATLRSEREAAQALIGVPGFSVSAAARSQRLYADIRDAQAQRLAQCGY